MDYNIFCVGDSITYGLSDSKGGWCDRLKTEFLNRTESDNSFRVWNFGISGQTIQDCFTKNERFKEPINRIKPNKKNIFVLAFGANDAAFDKEKQEFLTPKVEFESRYKELIKFYSNYGRCIIVGITPISKSIEGVADKYNCYRKNEFINQYNQILKEISNNDTPFLNIYVDFYDQKEGLLSSDGLHPNTDGHTLIGTKVKEMVLKVAS